VLALTEKYAKHIDEENHRRGRKDAQGYNRNSLLDRISGYRGEAAVAQVLGLEWKPDDAFQSRPDIGGFEVRTTKRPHGRLIIMPKDIDHRDYALVIDCDPRFEVVGHYRASKAKQTPNWWFEFRTNGGAWYIPRDVLEPFPSEKSLGLKRTS
jgi:hypothetical protein